jgi:DNA-binding GntR family transcriptional regulator
MTKKPEGETVSADTMLYLKVAEELRGHIFDGRYAPGSRLPSRADLAEAHHVSEQVVRRAVDVLTAEGLVFTQAGARPTVRGRVPAARMVRTSNGDAPGDGPFMAAMSALGRGADFDTKSARVKAPKDVAIRLEIAEGAEVMRFEYVFTANKQPMMLMTTFEPLEITNGHPAMTPTQGPFKRRSVHERMAALEQDITVLTEVLTAHPGSSAEAAQLGLRAGAVVIAIQRTYRSEDRPVETAEIVLPADRFELAYVIPQKLR